MSFFKDAHTFRILDKPSNQTTPRQDPRTEAMNYNSYVERRLAEAYASQSDALMSISSSAVSSINRPPGDRIAIQTSTAHGSSMMTGEILPITSEQQSQMRADLANGKAQLEEMRRRKAEIAALKAQQAEMGIKVRRGNGSNGWTHGNGSKGMNPPEMNWRITPIPITTPPQYLPQVSQAPQLGGIYEAGMEIQRDGKEVDNHRVGVNGIVPPLNDVSVSFTPYPETVNIPPLGKVTEAYREENSYIAPVYFS